MKVEFELRLRIDSLNLAIRSTLDPACAQRRRFALNHKIKMHRFAASMALLAHSSAAQRAQLLKAERLVITLTRIGPRVLDREDNLPAGFKAARDGLAKTLGVDDADPRLRWLYEQQKGEPNTYSAHVRLEGMTKHLFAAQLADAELER